MKKETQKTQSQSTPETHGKKTLSTKEAAEYLGFDYCNFRKQRNKGYFGRDRYPAPDYIFQGEGEQGMKYVKADLDRWLDNFPRHNQVALGFKQTAEAAAKAKRDSDDK